MFFYRRCLVSFIVPMMWLNIASTNPAPLQCNAAGAWPVEEQPVSLLQVSLEHVAPSSEKVLRPPEDAQRSSRNMTAQLWERSHEMDFGGCNVVSRRSQLMWKLPCKPTVLAALQHKGPGLIIGGQGGSATRVAQQIVEVLMTHDFGNVSNYSRDSCAVREVGLTLFYATGVMQTGTATYAIEDIGPPWLQGQILLRVCGSLMISDQMTQASDKPWALKEPWLRFLLPFYDRVIGTSNYKFLHVTRDVRNIHATHNDEQLASFLPTSPLDEALTSAMAVNSTIRSMQSGSNMVDVEKWVRFAYQWGILELELHKFWSQERAQNYFLLTELDMASFQQKPDSARKLAVFLGSSGPTQTELDQMSQFYVAHPLSPEDENHFEMMQAIIDLPGMDVTREAMKAFGYFE